MIPLPSPLHPAIVHFPIVLMFLLPLAALGALIAIRRGSTVTRAWIFPLVAAAALSASAWVAVETGEGDEDRVGDVVGEQQVEAHASAAERFLLLSGGVLLLTAAGLLRGAAGTTARTVAAIATLGLVVAGAQVGHLGGRLVYGGAGQPGLTQGVPAAGDRGPGEGEDARREGPEKD